MAISETCHFNMACASYFGQLLVSLIILVFCMSMVAYKDGKLEVYLPMITSTAAVWIPAPAVPKIKPKPEAVTS